MAMTKFITMRLDTKTHSALKQMAARDHRTLTNLLHLIMMKAVEKDNRERTVENV